MKRVMALATRLECNEESNGFGGKSNGNEDISRLNGDGDGDGVGDGDGDEAGGR
jgi:hypothetical protein